MAELIAVAASVIAVVQIADRIIGVCRLYIQTVRDAPKDLRNILLEISTLRTIFENLEFLTSCDSKLSTTISGLLDEDGHLEACRRSMIELEKLFPPQSIQTTTGRRVGATLRALAWPLKENKAKRLSDEISHYKANSTLVMTVENMYESHFIPIS